MSCVQVTAYIAHQGITHVGNGCVLETDAMGDIDRVIQRTQKELQRRIADVAPHVALPAVMLWIEWSTVEPDGRTKGTTLTWLLKSPHRRFLQWEMIIDGHLPDAREVVSHG